MNNPLGVSLSLWIRSTVTLPTELRGRTEKVGDDLGGESRRRESKGTYYINTSEIPSELSRENFISSHVKITCYLHM